MPSPPDSELVRRCLGDDGEQAWVVLTERYADLVYGVARRSGLSATDAGDVVQEVFLALLKALPRLKRSERVMAWILKTSRREAWLQVKRLRAARRRERVAAKPEAASGALPAAALAALESEQAVREAFRALSERCRRLLDALFFTAPPRTYAEIAADLSVPIGSIGPTRKRCLERLHEALVEEGFSPPDVSRGGGSSSRGAGRTTP